jgi:hypothetical protein
MFRVPDSLNMMSSIFVYICEIKGVFFPMTSNSSVLLYLFRAQISSNLLGIIYGKNKNLHPVKNTKLTPHIPHIIFETDALFMVSSLA